MRNTTEDFLKMVYERECSVIVMLSEFEEQGKVGNENDIFTVWLLVMCHVNFRVQEKCYQYWPLAKANIRIDGVKHGNYSVFTLDSKREDGYMMRIFGVTDHKVRKTQLRIIL